MSRIFSRPGGNSACSIWFDNRSALLNRLQCLLPRIIRPTRIASSELAFFCFNFIIWFRAVVSADDQPGFSTRANVFRVAFITLTLVGESEGGTYKINVPYIVYLLYQPILACKRNRDALCTVLHDDFGGELEDIRRLLR